MMFCKRCFASIFSEFSRVFGGGGVVGVSDVSGSSSSSSSSLRLLILSVIGGGMKVMELVFVDCAHHFPNGF